MMYTFTLVKEIELFDINPVITHGEHGWTIAQMDDYHSDEVFVRKSFEVEMASELEVMRYAEALHDMTFGTVFLLEAEAKGITICRNKEHCEWEMRRNGKTFRYDANYHLFEEVNNT